jgi:hypothetical protein
VARMLRHARLGLHACEVGLCCADGAHRKLELIARRIWKRSVVLVHNALVSVWWVVLWCRQDVYAAKLHE